MNDSKTALKLWVVLARAFNAVQQRMGEDVSRHGLTLAEFAVLEALYHKGPLLLGDVQKKVLVSSGGVTYLIDRLADRGLVRRKLCAEDRRARYAELTEEGKAQMDRIWPEHAHCIADVMSALNSDDQREAVRVLRELGVGAAAETV
ncbi:MAG TPA: MarR family transcriptional regulator [Longimicrobiales bacterium]|nr:MarR family transcriptional regulator [Longimicrobiales bacterium]